jgi:hypothetical protein
VSRLLLLSPSSLILIRLNPAFFLVNLKPQAVSCKILLLRSLNLIINPSNIFFTLAKPAKAAGHSPTGFKNTKSKAGMKGYCLKLSTKKRRQDCNILTA